MSPRRRRRLQGLTGLVILLCLAQLVIPRLMAARFATDCCSVTSMNLRALASAVAEYAIEHHGALPGSLQALYDEAYLGSTEVPKDPYGSPYAYRTLDDGTSFLVASLGSDGQLGGDGDAADEVRLVDLATGERASLFTYDGWTRPER
jgi:hypothetical protein